MEQDPLVIAKYVYWGLGYPITLYNVQYVHLYGGWHPKIDIRKVAKEHTLRDYVGHIMYDSVLEFFGSDEVKTNKWWRTNNTLLGNNTPINMIVIGRQDKLNEFISKSLDENKY